MLLYDLEKKDARFIVTLRNTESKESKKVEVKAGKLPAFLDFLENHGYNMRGAQHGN